jgi:hypothetical protein
LDKCTQIASGPVAAAFVFTSVSRQSVIVAFEPGSYYTEDSLFKDDSGGPCRR